MKYQNTIYSVSYSITRPKLLYQKIIIFNYRETILYIDNRRVRYDRKDLVLLWNNFVCEHASLAREGARK